jgi:hypothetical protein
VWAILEGRFKHNRAKTQGIKSATPVSQYIHRAIVPGTKNEVFSIMVKIRLISFDEICDIFTFSAFGFTPEDEAEDPTYSRSAPDFDDFNIPGILIPSFIGESGEPSELVGRVFTVALT